MNESYVMDAGMDRQESQAQILMPSDNLHRHIKRGLTYMQTTKNVVRSS